jgi:hypothetical protein
MSKRRLALAALLVGGLMGWILLGTFLLKTALWWKPSPHVYNTATVLQQVQSLSQLVTVKYVMEKVVILDDPPQNPVRKLLPDDTRIILVAHGIVKAGVDLSQIKPADVRVSGQSVRVKLPAAQITDAYLDEKQTQVIQHNTSFMRDFNKDLEHTARQNAVSDIARAARASGILRDADERAREQLKHFFRQLGFDLIEVETR